MALRSLSSRPYLARNQDAQRPRIFSSSKLCRLKSTTAAKASSASLSIVDLKKKFDVPGSIEFKEGKGGLPIAQLFHTCGSSVEVNLFGATITSWKQPSGDEVLYLRPDAVFDRSKPIAGGMPICFPQFGPGPLPQHGFARGMDWTVSTASADPNPDDLDAVLELTLESSPSTLAIWPHKFRAHFLIILHGNILQTQLRIINADSKPFSFTAGLHSYFEVLEARKARVTGLQGVTYLDKSKDPKNPEKKLDDLDSINIRGYTERIYLDAPPHVDLEVGTGAAVAAVASGWEDVVVWNPWHTMKSCFDHFVCVEHAKIGKPVELSPGDSWVGSANFNVVDFTA